MLLIGHKLIPFSPLYPIESVDEIAQTPPSSTVLFEYNPELIWHCRENSISFALHVSNVTEAVIGNGANAKLLIASMHLAIELQKLAEHYLFDSKIAVMADEEEAITDVAKHGIDALILPEGIISWK
jgi:hypothetical protein